MATRQTLPRRQDVAALCRRYQRRLLLALQQTNSGVITTVAAFDTAAITYAYDYAAISRRRFDAGSDDFYAATPILHYAISMPVERRFSRRQLDD